MCALFGWLDCGKKLPYKTLRKLTQVLANAAEERGTDASGIAYVQNGTIEIYKKAKPAHKMKFSFPEGTTAVMGHTRLTTQGNQKFNFNNHPFYGKADKEFAFAHNGVLHNDMELKKEKNLPETKIETDSYVAVQLIEKHGRLNFESLKNMAEDVDGSFTFTILDEDNKLYFVKGSSPMCLIYIDKLDLYVYASTESIMKNALKKSGLFKFQHQHMQMNEGDIISISSAGKIDCSEFTPRYSLKYNYSWYDEFDEYGIYSEHEQMLLDVCGYFGASADDVRLLFDYGYTADEAEEFIMDSKLMQEVLSEIKQDFSSVSY